MLQVNWSKGLYWLSNPQQSRGKYLRLERGNSVMGEGMLLLWHVSNLIVASVHSIFSNAGSWKCVRIGWEGCAAVFWDEGEHNITIYSESCDFHAKWRRIQVDAKIGEEINASKLNHCTIVFFSCGSEGWGVFRLEFQEQIDPGRRAIYSCSNLHPKMTK